MNHHCVNRKSFSSSITNDPMRRSRRHFIDSTHRRGLTLIECLVATVLLTFSVMAAATALSASYQQQLAADERAEASLLGERLISEVVAKPYEPEDAIVSPTPSGGGLLSKLLDGVVEPVLTTVGWVLGIEVADAELEAKNAATVNTLHGMGDVVTGPSGKQYARRVSIEQMPDLGSNTAVVVVEVVTPGGDVVSLRRLLIPDIK